MILLDTNVVSEAMRRDPSQAVLNWLDEHSNGSLLISSITVAEICYGLRILPLGQRREFLSNRFESFIAQGFSGRIVNFDEAAARVYADLMGQRRDMGRPMSLPDGQIAAIAHTHQLRLDTRNTTDIEHCGIELIDPFD